MNIREQLKAKKSRAAELAKLDRDFTDAELEEATTLATEIKELGEKLAKMDAASAALRGIEPDESKSDDHEEGGTGATSPPQGGAKTRDRDERAAALSFGEKFVKSDEYKAFRKENPSGVGQGSPVNIGRVKVGSLDEYWAGRKSVLTSPLARTQPIRMPTIDLVDRNRLTFLDLISRGQTGGNFEYVQITGVTRNAAIVPEATSATDDNALKPVSDMTTELADAKVYTYADGYDVTNQLLADAPAFATYMNQELEYSLDNVVEDKLLNGTGASGEPKGILTTTGVQQQSYVTEALGADGGFTEATVMNFIRAARRAITKVTRLPGGTVDAIVLSPEMDESIDLLQDQNGRFYGQGPFGSGPGTLWGRPRVTSERLVDTQSILGDFKQVALLDREGLSVMAFNQHKDYAQRNMTYVRAELRAAQVIWKPSRLVVIKPATGGGE
ncbi:phage major capsid protein [Rhodococcus hoagii]|nr:phage major capsid protein [Prescottella equi]NKZ92219.1 phage major capsid protein [Prescottella equi]